MIPRTEIFAISSSATKDEIIDLIIETQHTRIPIYKDNLDNILGFIHIKDVLRNIRKDFSISEIIRAIIFIPMSMKLPDLLIRMKSYKVHAAIVIDEYSGTEGLITLADIIEELVGEIEDEHDIESEPYVIKIEPSKYEVSARINLDDLEKKVPIVFDKKDEYETLSGFLCNLCSKIPIEGEIISYNNGNITFLIVEASYKAVNKVIIQINHNFENQTQN